MGLWDNIQVIKCNNNPIFTTRAAASPFDLMTSGQSYFSQSNRPRHVMVSSGRICYAFLEISRFDEDNTVTYTSPRPQFQKFCVVNIKLTAIVYFTNHYPSPNFISEAVDVWNWITNWNLQIVSCSIAIAKSSISFRDAENKWNKTKNTSLRLSPKFHMTHIQISISAPDWYFKWYHIKI